MRKQIEKKCNCCGQVIKTMEPSSQLQDHVGIEKTWGYFSEKDLEKHSFCICEACYDKWIATFAIPVKKEAVEDIFPEN